MFGYILPDKPNMYVKDYNLYRAYFCGLCKTTKKTYGNIMRFGVNYDITFIDIMIHGLLGQTPTIKEGVCILNPLQKKPYVVINDISKSMTHLNVLFADFKARDDIADSPKLKKVLFKLLIRRKVQKAKAAMPQIAIILDKAFIRQQAIEKEAVASIDRAADAFATAMDDIYKILLDNKYTEQIGVIAYNLAKFVYILDAIDDFESDVKANEYNVFRLMYPKISTKTELIDIAETELKQIINGVVESIREAYETVDIQVNEGVVTNTLWFGLRSRAVTIMKKECIKCQRTRF